MNQMHSHHFESFFATKNYLRENEPAYSTPAITHPLLGFNTFPAAAKDGSTVADTPRTDGAGEPLKRLLEGSDPLSLMAAMLGEPAADDAPSLSPSERKAAPCARGEGGWSAWRRGVLSQCSTADLVPVYTGDGETVALGTTSRTRVRLAQLQPSPDDVTGRNQLTQHECVAHITRMKQQLQESWKTDQRVKALKVVIQACKLLEDVSVPQFYPSLFVLVTDILDVFGSLVHNRVVSKDTDRTSAGELVSESGREMCRNWFYKVSSIRELLARLYVEMALLRCYDLLQPRSAELAAARLVSAIRGVGSPLAAAYARTYLAKVAPPSVLTANLEDFIAGLSPRTVAPSWRIPSTVVAPTKQPPVGPALQWCLSRAVSACADDKRDAWLEELQQQNGVQGSSLVLMALLNSAGADHLSARAVQYVEAVDACSDTVYRRGDLLAALGVQLALGCVSECDRLHALNTAWRQLQELTTLDEYMACVTPWCRYVATYFGPRQMAVVLRDAVDHLSADRQTEQLQQQLLQLLLAAVGDGRQLPQLSKLTSFTALLQLLQQDQLRVQLHRQLLHLVLEGEADLTAETSLAELALTCCQVLHDQLSMLSLGDERREVSALICRLLSRAVDSSQPESALDLLVQARGSFYNLETVTVHLISSVHHLAATARSSGSRRGRSFQAACIAFCFITLPALDDVIMKLKLYVLTAQLALASGCLGQAEACMKTAVTGMPEIPAQLGRPERGVPVLPQTLELVKSLLSTLLVFPDQPSQPPLYLVSGVLAALVRLPWLQGTDALASLYLQVLRLLAALSQPRYLYTVSGVDANDTLYGGDQQMVTAIGSLTEDVIGRLTSHLRLDSQSPLSRSQNELAAELCMFLLRGCHVTNSSVSTSISQLVRSMRLSSALPPYLQVALTSAGRP